MTGNNSGDQNFHVAGSERVFLTPAGGYRNDTIGHELGHHVDHVLAHHELDGGQEQQEVHEGVADMFAYDADQEDATFRFVQQVRYPVAGFLLYRTPALVGPVPHFTDVANAFVNVATAAYPESPQTAAAARQAFLTEGGMDRGPQCIPAAPPSPPAPAPAPAPAPTPAPAPAPAPAPTKIAVPGVRGESPGAAGSTLRAAGLSLGAQRQVVDSACADIGNVLSQSPAAGVLVGPGTAVDITIGKAPSHPCP